MSALCDKTKAMAQTFIEDIRVQCVSEFRDPVDAQAAFLTILGIGAGVCDRVIDWQEENDIKACRDLFEMSRQMGWDALTICERRE